MISFPACIPSDLLSVLTQACLLAVAFDHLWPSDSFCWLIVFCVSSFLVYWALRFFFSPCSLFNIQPLTTLYPLRSSSLTPITAFPLFLRSCSQSFWIFFAHFLCVLLSSFSFHFFLASFSLPFFDPHQPYLFSPNSSILPPPLSFIHSFFLSCHPFFRSDPLKLSREGRQGYSFILFFIISRLYIPFPSSSFVSIYPSTIVQTTHFCLHI